MSTWSPSEFAALFQAWREALDTPLHERNKISHEVFRRFSVLMGGSTERSEGSVSFKQGSLKNMTMLVMAFNDRDKWFAFSLEQKKVWFKMVNRKSYKFIDLDRPLFRTIEKLVQHQATSTNMRVTSASGSIDAATYAESSFLRVKLRRSPINRKWGTHGSPPVVPPLYAPELPVLPIPRAPRQHAPAFLPPPAPVAIPHAHAPRKEFPFLAAPPRGASDSRSIFAPDSSPSRPAQQQKPQSAVVQGQHVRSSSRNNVIVFDDGEYDSGSSTESDSDVELWEESQSVAARLKYLETKSAPVPAAPAIPDHQIEPPPAQHGKPRSPDDRPPFTDQTEKRSRPPLSPLFVSSVFKKQKIDPELMMVVNILEKQAQELKTLLAEVKGERANDEQQRQKELQEKSARDIEIQQIVETIKMEADIRQKEHEQRVIYQEERRQLTEEIARLHEERKEFEQERKREEEARAAMLEQIAQDHEERRKDLKQQEREIMERENFAQQIQQDRVDRKRARDEQNAFRKQGQQVGGTQKARAAKDTKVQEKVPAKPQMMKSANMQEKLPERPKRDSVGASTSRSTSSSTNRQTEQENKRPSSARDTDSKTLTYMMSDRNKMREDPSHARPQRSGNGRPLDDKIARGKKLR